MINKSQLLVCLLLTAFMVIVKAKPKPTSANETSNDTSIDVTSIRIPLNNSTIGKALLSKLEIKRQDEEESSSVEDATESKDTTVSPKDVSDETDQTETADLSGSEETMTEHTGETDGTDETEDNSSTHEPGAKEDSAVCFKPAIVYFLLLPLCITAKGRLLW